VFLEVEKLALRSATIVTLLAILVIAIALPFAMLFDAEHRRELLQNGVAARDYCAVAPCD
jgi:hypothetical protein